MLLSKEGHFITEFDVSHSAGLRFRKKDWPSKSRTSGHPISGWYSERFCIGLGAAYVVVILLYVAHFVVHGMWKLKTDPDNSSIPYLTALGDLTGSCLLGVGFLFLKHIHYEYSG
ncbi:hypothetical protein PR048_012368 [Dryococelus australis]|uniref:SLC41A/MgtE integral membrane domain-containing protein n=1 Tax=Dryococelus australis TaxID=614101 RepID=A0ABQ9HP77_9NEOP|nr:hypothetical protein PR048_012368 [Dryococelus australis]